MQLPFPVPYHWTLRTWAGRHAGLFAVIYRLGNRGEDRLASPGMDFVIDGFPRSGNSFAHYALLHSARRDMRFAEHVHAPAQIILAANLGIPALVVLRDPAEAVAGALIKNPRFRAPDLLRAYRLYYASLLPLAEHFVVSPFEVAVQDDTAPTISCANSSLIRIPCQGSSGGVVPPGSWVTPSITSPECAAVAPVVTYFADLGPAVVAVDENTVFPIGTTPVEAVATDSSTTGTPGGNVSAPCFFTIEVVDYTGGCGPP